MKIFHPTLRAWAALGLALLGFNPSALALLDLHPPVILCPDPIVAVAQGNACTAVVEFEVPAEDLEGETFVFCDPPSGSSFPLGTTVVHCIAFDEAENSSTCEFVVTVTKALTPSAPCQETIDVMADPGKWGATVHFATPTLQDACLDATVVCEPPSGSFFPVGSTTVTATAVLPWGSEVVCTFQVVVEDPGNIVWPRSMVLPLVDNLGVLHAGADQALTEVDQSRWYKFRVQPGSRVIATLTGLPANYDLVLFKDIAEAYREITSPQDLPLLDAEFAEDAFSPAQFSPAQFSPAQFSPAAFSPAAFSPAQFSPAQFSPAQFSPAQFSPAQFSPDAYAPAQFSPAQFSPAQFSPAQFSPAQFSPAQFSPAQFSEAAYASAQTRSVIAVSAFDGTAGEGVIANTWNEDTEFYLRVRGRQGAFDPDHTFRVDVFLLPGLCKDVSPIPTAADGTPLPASTVAAPAGGYKTLILTDLNRLTGAGPSAERTELEARLTDLAARPEVQGYILDVASDPWVAFFNAQADTNFECPYGKNLVAGAIRDLILRSRVGNALEYIVIVGSDSVIPFFRYPDEALLGPEQDYFPPVQEFTASQASLRQNYFLTQDPYGALCELPRKNTRLPLPDLAVGRLVERPTEISGMIEAYLSTGGGVLPSPASTLVSGYDFLSDAATAVAAELQLGTGITPQTLITPYDVAPGDPDSWSADDLRALLLTQRHDMMYLAGHFSAVGLLAADYTTRMLASELLASPIDFTHALLYSPGCHSGYNIVDPDAVPFITYDPDWSQVCARKRITLLAGTGYQYGDTDFIEYSERLYLLFTRGLRSGLGPVPLGKALVAAKQEYLATIVNLKGIHEKALLQSTLFGLPMLSYDFAGQRLPAAPGQSIVDETQTYSSVPPTPGEVLGLRYADVTVDSALTRHDVILRNAHGDPNAASDITATWYSGSDGVLAQPAEPVLPLEIRGVDVPDFYLRGIGFRGATYEDLPDIIALTGAATTEIRGVHPAFVSEIFFPTTFWRANYFGDLCTQTEGGTRLMVTPAQVRTYPGEDLGVIRRYPQSQFRLFYSANTETYTDAQTGSSATPALSGPPSISNVRSWTEDGTVHFRVQVIGNPAAGIQAVWINYTALEGPLYGAWAPLDLTQDPEDSRVWTGSLPLGPTSPGAFRFLVQAVNGVGLVAFSANLGAYFTPDQTEEPSEPVQAAQLELLEPPANATYATPIPLRARLTGNGAPLAQHLVVFKLGALESRARTDASGIASATLNPLLTPGTYALRAAFPGGTDFSHAFDETNLAVERGGTVLTLDPDSAIVAPNATATLVAHLTDAVSGRAIAEQTIIFRVTGEAGNFVTTTITDVKGSAPLGQVPLPPGTYTVDAFFAQSVTAPPPLLPVGSSHPLYQPSQDTGSLTLDPGAPIAGDDVVEGSPGLSLKIPIADLLANDEDPNDDALQLDSVDATTVRGTTITRADPWLLVNVLSSQNAADAFEYAIKDTAGNVARARVLIRLLIDNNRSANLLGVTVDDGLVRIRFAGIPGRTYQIQFSATGAPFQWVTLGSATAGTDGTAEFSTPHQGGVGFFRTAQP